MSGTSNRAISAQTFADVEPIAPHPSYDRVQAMILACRLLAMEGHESGIAGQISARDDGGRGYWTLPFVVGFEEARRRDFVLVDDDLRPVEGERIPNPALRFHLWIYRMRSDVRCIIHTHAPNVSALSMIGEPLVVAHMDTTPFHDDVAYLAEWPGVPVADVEGEIISRALGKKRAILLAHHGLLVAASSVEEAAYLSVRFERAAQLQLAARAAGTIRPIRDDLARQAHDFMLMPQIVSATFNLYARRVLRTYSECLD